MEERSRFVRLRRRTDRPAGAPVFERVAVIGLEGLGSAIALATRRAWPTVLVIGVDAADPVERAIRFGTIDVGSRDLGVIGGADLVVIASASVDRAGLVPALGDLVSGTAVVTDVGDRSATTRDLTRHLPSRLLFVNGWIVGAAVPAHSEADAADGVVGRPWLLAAEPGAAPGLDRMGRFVEGLGAIPEVLSLGEFERRCGS